jgi:hypothetical protein
MPDRATSAMTLPIRIENRFKPEEIPSEGVTKSISAPLDRKAARQLQYHWIRNKHQSLTKSNENTIFHDSLAKYRLLHIPVIAHYAKTVEKQQQKEILITLLK